MCRKPCSQVSRQCGLPVTCFRQLSSQACQSEVVRTRASMFTWTNTCVAGLITLEPYLVRALLPQGCHLWVSAPTLVSLYLGLSVIILTTFQSSLILCRFISALIQTRYIWHRSMYEYIFTATPTAGTCYYITCLHYSAFELVFQWFLSIPASLQSYGKGSVYVFIMIHNAPIYTFRVYQNTLSRLHNLNRREIDTWTQSTKDQHKKISTNK